MLLLSAGTALALAGAGLACERLGLLRLAHFVVTFAFFTVNLWSIKGSNSLWLSGRTPGQRLLLSMLALFLVLYLSTSFTRGKSGRWRAVEQRTGWFLGLMLGLTVVTSFCQFESAPADAPGSVSQRNLIVVSFDALSAEHVSAYGYDRPTTPNFDRLARESWMFSGFHSNFTNTTPCMVSLAGTLPSWKTGAPVPNGAGLWRYLHANGFPHQAFFSYFPPSVFFQFGGMTTVPSFSGRETLPYRALSVVFSQRHLVWSAGLLSEEFAYFWPYHRDYDARAVFERTNRHPASQSFDDGLKYLREHPNGGVFVWMHIWVPHYPYWSQPDLRGKFGPTPPVTPGWINQAYTLDQAADVESLRNRYDETVFEADRELGKFVEQLRSHGLLDKSWLVVTADHGESFRQGYLGHAGASVNEAICHIPLLIRPPGPPQAKKIDTLAVQVDLAPTIFQLLELPPRAGLPGESLVPYIEEPSKLSEAYKFTVSEWVTSGKGGPIAVYWNHYKTEYMSDDPTRVRLVDLRADPLGEQNIAVQHPDLVDQILRGGGAR